ncbi:extracellular solute-binding protein [Paenibacillus sp. Soil750]|uniref:extracellular solute-binding protein n=1 Tax=Paenibacillus sp. Soil750 TaxID=1736398 RepID=UPI0009EAAE33|nr:extracellular solute-binding protein [Paenibacillus sp. Soil750]
MKGFGKMKGKMVLVLSMITVMLAAACSNESKDGPKATEKNPTASATANAVPDPYSSLPKKVSISMFDRGKVSSDEGTYEKNRWVDYIRKESGIDLSIVPVPRAQSKDKLNVLIASNQAPDLIWEFDRSYIGKLVTQGALQPINEYIDKYSTSYKKYLKENPDLLPHITFDGKIYAAVTKRPVTAVANHGMWIRQDWLDELNLKAPTTVDELITVAQAFKNKYPGSTPIVGANASDIYAALYGAMNSQWYVEDGKMKYGATLDRFADVISLEKKLFNLGLVDREYFTDNNNQRSNQLWTTGKAGIMLGQWLTPLNADLLKNVPNANPVPLEAVSTKYGKYGVYQEASPFIYVAFNKNMKNPKAAIEYLDWMVDKGWYPLLNGEKGVHYEDVGGVAKRLNMDKYNKEVSYAAEYAVLRQEVVKPEDLVVQAASDPLSQRIAKLDAKALETALKVNFRRDIPYQPNFDEINVIRTSFDTFIKEIRAEATTQGDKYSGEWALGEIRKEWARLGGAKAEEIANKWYQDNKASFK